MDGALTLSKEVIDGVGALSLDTVATNDGFGHEFISSTCRNYRWPDLPATSSADGIE